MRASWLVAAMLLGSAAAAGAQSPAPSPAAIPGAPLPVTPPAVPAGAPTVTVSNAWARATPGRVSTGAAYVTVAATGAADRLVGVATPVAGIAEVHETIADKGVMQMRPVAGGIALEPGTPVTLKPGGYHLMLMDLKHGLVAGDVFPVTLTFAHAPPVTVNVIVEPPGSPGPNSP